MGQGGGAVQGAGYRRTKAKRHATARHPQQGCANRAPTHWQARLSPHPGATGACSRGASSEGDEGKATP